MAQLAWRFERKSLEAIDELRSLWITTFTHAYSQQHDAEDIAAYCAAHYRVADAVAVLGDPHTICKFAYGQQVAVGFYILSDRPCPLLLTQRGVELRQIYVLQSAYGTGLGRELLADAMHEARAQQARLLWLAVADTNVRAQAFYRKLGFARAGVGPTFAVGRERLSSTILQLPLQ